MEIIHTKGARIGLEKSEDKNPKTAVLLVPGMSGSVFSGKFDNLKNAILKKGFSYIPIEIWRDRKDMGTLTIKNIFSAIDESISALQKRGYNNFYAVGKSFGGGMLLARNHPLIKKLVLWAPAIGIGKKETISTIIDLPLNKVKTIFDIILSPDDLLKIKIPVIILQGNDDKVVSRSASEELSSLLPNSNLKIFNEMGHSPKNELEENILADMTVAVL